MAERRMFAKSIIDSDVFIDMPATARLLYFDLGMRADDDGFIDSQNKIMRMTGATKEDLKALIDNSFIIPFDTGIIVIRHWRINNYLRADRYNPTLHQNEMTQLSQDETRAYELRYTDGIPDDIPMVDTGENREVKKMADKMREGVCESEGVKREGTETGTHAPSLEQVESSYLEICHKHGVTPISGEAQRFLGYTHKNWGKDLLNWVEEDISRGKYNFKHAQRSGKQSTGRFDNYKQSGTNWDEVADRIMKAQERETEQVEMGV